MRSGPREREVGVGRGNCGWNVMDKKGIKGGKKNLRPWYGTSNMEAGSSFLSLLYRYTIGFSPT